MDYQQTLNFLYSHLDPARLPRNRPEDNLPRTRTLLALAGNPERQFPSVLVAGTKGKGSTCALLEAIARAAGYRTGLWTSPHLHSYRERIQLDRVPISRAALVSQIATLKPLLEQYDGRFGHVTTFELGLVAALCHFAASQVQLAVLEIGVGGLFDNTNAVEPLVSVITSISYDHMDILGETLTAIAAQKAGIMRPGVAAVTVPQTGEVQQTLARAATQLGAQLRIADAAGVAGYGGPLTTPHLRGAFQQENARLAVAAALALRDTGLNLPDAAIAAGLANASWPGRLELVSGSPPIVLDGAHNGDSAQRLVAALAELYPGRPVTLMLGFSADKDLPRMLAALAPAAHAVVLTRSWHPRAQSDLDVLERQIAAYATGPLSIRQEPEIAAALDTARTLAGPAGLVCVTGSLFVVAAAREALGLAYEKD